MANKTVYPYGTDGSLPSSVGIINDLSTGGVDKALSAQQGVIIGDELFGEVDSLIEIVRDSRQEGAVLRTTGAVETVSGQSAVDTFLDVEPFKTYYVSGRVGNGENSCLICFYDENDVFISAHITTDGVATPFLDVRITAPENANIMRVAGNTATSYPYEPALKYEHRVGGFEQRIQEVEKRMEFVKSFDLIAIPTLTLPLYIGSSTLKWTAPSGGVNESSAIIKVRKGQRLQIVANATNNSRFAFLSDYRNASEGASASLLSDYPETILVSSGTTELVEVPIDCYLYVMMRSGEQNIYRPQHIYTEGNNFFQGLKSIWQGPSVMQGVGCQSQDNRFSNRVAQYFGMTCTNYAITGSTVGKKPGSYESAFVSLSAWQSAVSGGQVDTTKTYLVKDNGSADFPWAIYSYSGGAWSAGARTPAGAQRTPIVDRIAEMATDADVIFVQGGTNDFQYDWDELGDDWDTAITTVKGATRAICDYLVNTYPKKMIVWLTSLTPYRYQGANTTPYSKNSLGYSGWDSHDAEMEVCEAYGIPVIDIGAEIGLSPSNPWWDDYDSSGTRVHPNDDGHRIAAAYLVKKLLTMQESL